MNDFVAADGVAGLIMGGQDVSFEVALFATVLLAKGHNQHSQGQRPWNLTRNGFVWPTAMINPLSFRMNMAVGQRNHMVHKYMDRVVRSPSTRFGVCNSYKIRKQLMR